MPPERDERLAAIDASTDPRPVIEGKPFVFCFIIGEWGSDRAGRGDVSAVALAEDGIQLQAWTSSNREWAMHDLGVSSGRNHDVYRKHYPEGFNVVWIEDTKRDLRVVAAFERRRVLLAADGKEVTV